MTIQLKSVDPLKLDCAVVTNLSTLVFERNPVRLFSCSARFCMAR